MKNHRTTKTTTTTNATHSAESVGFPPTTSEPSTVLSFTEAWLDSKRREPTTVPCHCDVCRSSKKAA